MFNTGILRRSRTPYKAVGEIPEEVHALQGTWQNYGQYDEIPADKVYKRIESGSFKGQYEDKFGDPVRDKTGMILEDTYDETGGEWIKPNISNAQLKSVLVEEFKTPKGKKYLNEVIDALPKNPDGSITAYRIGNIGGEGAQSYTLSEGMAKTFSNQGTDIPLAGTPGLPKGGYKDFGVLPVNTVKIDPKGIVAWSPYDAEILVEPKYVTTKSQLTNIWNKANKKTNVNPLLEEARKYKSAEEFVKAQGEMLYHGTNETVLENIKKEGLKPGMRGQISLSTSEDYAKSFAREGVTPQGKTKSVLLRVNSGLLRGKTTTKRLDGKMRPLSDQKFELLTKETIPPEAIEIFENNQWVSLVKSNQVPQIKTKSQLTDIWNQANLSLKKTKKK